MQLVEEKFERRHSLYIIINFSNSIDLSKQLPERKTYITGTFCVDKKGNLKEVTQKIKKGKNLLHIMKELR